MIKTEDLMLMSRIINMKKLCEEAGLNYFNLYNKINRGTEIKVDESEKLEKTLNNFRLQFIRNII